MNYYGICCIIRRVMAPVVIGGCLLCSGLLVFAVDDPAPGNAKAADDLAQQVTRATYLAKVKGMTERELLAVISHKLDLLLEIERKHLVDNH